MTIPRSALAALAAAILMLPPQAEAQRFASLTPSVREFVAVPEGLFAITGVRLMDGTGSPARENMTVVVRDGRIAAVGPSASVQPPAGARIIDGRGHTLLPGLVMLHEHLFYPAGALRYNTNQNSFPPLYLAGGVTTMRTGGSMETYTDLRIAREVE
ncbi:MAG TPA: hypothetical protein VF862_09195, partial [Gemmatimonadales bacterium]